MAVEPDASGGAGSLFATLPMYDWPEVAPAWDTYWQVVRAELAAAGIDTAPDLRRSADPQVDWDNPALVLGQTCGWPYVSSLRSRVTPLARFDFALPTRHPGDYFSVFVMHANRATALAGPRGLAALIGDPATTIAVNSLGSQSGFRVLGECFDSPVDIPRQRLLLTGSHRQSVRAVAAGRATLAAIDAVSWRLALAHEPAAGAVTAVTRSADAPGLPLIISRELAGLHGKVFDALSSAVASMPEETSASLGLAGIVAATDTDYTCLLDPPFTHLRVSDGNVG